MSFNTIQITAKGRALLARAQTGTIINFTHIKMGDGSMTGQSIDEMADVINQKASLNINSLKVLTGGKVKVSATFTNQSLSTGFYWRELAVFATDPDNPSTEIMYCYGNAGALADYIPPEGSQILERVISVLTIISNAENVTATIDSSNVYVTVQDAEATYTKKNDFNAHLSDYVRQPGYALTAGSANAYTVTLNPAPTAYVDGMGIVVKIHVANTGASTINANGLGAKDILKSDLNLISAGGLKAGGIYSLRYNAAASVFILQGKGGDIPKLPNLIKNGSFENDANNWLINGFNVTFVAGSGKYGTKAVKMESTAGNTSQFIRQDCASIPAGHKIYAGAWVYLVSYTSGELPKIALSTSPNLVDGAYGTVYADGAKLSQWQYISMLGINTTAGINFGLYELALAGTVCFCDGAIMIDLTEAYGTGNEPTKAEIDEMVQRYGGWWDNDGSKLIGDTTTLTTDVLADKVFYGANMYRAVGAIPNYAGISKDAANLATDGNGNLWLNPQQGYYTGASAIKVYDPDFIAANIVKDKGVFGLTGSYDGRQIQIMHNVMTSSPLTFYLLDGTPRDKACIQVTGLTAIPRVIVVNSEDNGLEMVTYNAYASLLNGYYALLVNNWWYRVDGQCYVNNTGFRLPISDENVSRCTVTIVY